MKTIFRSLPFLPSVYLLGALSTKPNTLFRPLFGWLAAFVAFLALMTVVCLVSYRRPDPGMIRSRKRYVFVCAAVFAAAVYLSTTFLPLRVRVLLSEPFIRPRVSALSRAAKPLRLDPWRAGLFSFEGGSSKPGLVELSLGSCGLFCDAALAYSPSGRPSDQSGLVSDHLYGPWWHLTFGPDYEQPER